MDASERIRFARSAVGLTHTEVAEAIGLNLPSYYDLEGSEDELTMCISLREIQALGRVLNVSPAWLVTGESLSMENDFGLSSVPVLIGRHLEESGMALSDFEEQAGWEVGEVLADGEAVWDWNVDCLKDVCRVLGVDWQSVLPRVENHDG